MKAKFTRALSFLLLLILLFPVNAFALVFDVSNDELKKVAHELRKFDIRLENLKINELSSLRTQQEDLLRQIEEIKQILPQLQGAVELNKSETLTGLDKTNTKLDDLAAEVKNQVLEKIDQQNKNLQLFREDQANLKEGLAQDIEKFEQSSKTNFDEFAAANDKTLGRVAQQLEEQSTTTKKVFDDTIDLFRTDVIPTIAEENKKSRDMVLKRLTNVNEKLIEALKKDMENTHASFERANKNIASNHSVMAEAQKALSVANKNLLVADEKINKLAGSLQALQAQNTVSNEALATLKAELEQAREFNKLADEKLNKLIDLSSNLATHSIELESSVVGQLKDLGQKEDARIVKVDLANERLSRLIEILKVIVKEQEKLGPVATTLGKMQKDQEALQKTQTGLRKSQGEIKGALADLRRKANVNISRNDDIKKTLGQLSSSGK